MCYNKLNQRKDVFIMTEITKDMKSKKVMNRMLIGDVGSGKTVVALATAYLAIKSGYQAVVLCPTEILAEQHFETAEKLFSKLSVKTCLLHSKLKKSEKDGLYTALDFGCVWLERALAGK